MSGLEVRDQIAEQLVESIAFGLHNRGKLYVPQSPVRSTSIRLLTEIAQMHRPETQEGSSYDDSTLTIEHRLPVRINDPGAEKSIWFSDQRTRSNMITVTTLGELNHDMNQKDNDEPYLRELVSRNVHEHMHGLTGQAWQLQTATLTEISTQVWENMGEHDTRKAYQEKLQGYFYASRNDLKDPDEIFRRAYETRLELLPYILAEVPDNNVEFFIRESLLAGIGEIVSSRIDNKILGATYPIECTYSSFYYAAQRLDMILPTPTQHKMIARAIDEIQLPLDDDGVELIRSISDDRFLRIFTNETSLHI